MDYRFTFTNEGESPVSVLSVETLAGRRKGRSLRTTLTPIIEPGTRFEHVEGLESGEAVSLELGLLLPGQSFVLEMPYRVVAGREKALLTLRPTTREALLETAWLTTTEAPGRFRRPDSAELEAWAKSEAPPIREVPRALFQSPRRTLFPAETGKEKLPEVMLEFLVPAPPRPFDPWGRVGAWVEWTWSTALGGFVIRLRSDQLRLVTGPDASERLPGVPLAFLDAVDDAADEIILTEGGERIPVHPESLLGLLRDLHAREKEIAGPFSTGDGDLDGPVSYTVR